MPWLTPTKPYSVPRTDDDFLAVDPNQPILPLSIPSQKNQALDPNLIMQLEQANAINQSMQQPSIDLSAMQQMPAAPAPQAAPRPMRQMPTQEELNISNQEANAPAMPLSVPEQLAQAYQQQQALQDEAIKNAEAQLAAARSRPQQMDLSPLIALAESWSQQPSGLLRAYRPPTDQAKTVQALQEAVLKARGGAAELARMRAKDVAQLEESKEAREQRLQEIALKRRELGLLSSSKSQEREEAKILGVRKDYNKSFGNTISGLSEVMNAAERIKAIINEAGGIPARPDDPRRKEYISAVSQMTTGFNRDVAKLGALAGADLELLNAVIANSTSAVDAYFKNLVGRGAIQGTLNVLDGIMQRGDSTMDEYQQRVKDTYLGYADEPFKNQKALYKKAREQGRQRKAIQFGPSEDEETTTGTPAKKWTEEELVNLQKTNPEEFERVIERVIGRK